MPPKQQTEVLRLNNKYSTVDTKDLVTTIAYMIGIRKNIVEQCFDEPCHELLQSLYSNKPATIIRYLCKLRTTLFRRYKKTDSEMRYNLKNLHTLEWYDHENIKHLEEWGIHIIKANYRSDKYMFDLNELIANHIDECSSLFPDWCEWKYIRELFVIPHYNNPVALKREFEKYMKSNNFYPFQMYIYWTPYDCGSMLMSDRKFLQIIYGLHNDSFEDTSKYRDANDETKNNIYEFIRRSMRTVIAVDCENSDVYKLYATLKNLDQSELDKIEKIYLYDDHHTTAGWQWLDKFTEIPVEHIMIDRVTERKSLVDIVMTAGVCQSHYAEGIDSFILVSSDSDFWGLITSLPNAKFLVMYEYENCGKAIKSALEEHDIYYCAIDDFCSGNVDGFKRAVLLGLLQKYLPDILYLNGKSLVEHLYEEAWISGTESEKKAFYERYVKTLTLKIDKDGNFTVEVKK